MEHGTFTLTYHHISPGWVEASLVEHPAIRGLGKTEEEAREEILGVVLKLMEDDQGAKILSGLASANRMMDQAFDVPGLPETL